MLDAGPLVLLDRGEQRMLAWLEVARQKSEGIRTPATAVAEVWRGGPRAARLARALHAIEVVEIDIQLARAAGELLARASAIGASRRSLAVDALVVTCAATFADFVLTTDPSDIRPLADVAGVQVKTP